VVGDSSSGGFFGPAHAVIWNNNSAVQDLGTLGGAYSWAWSINNLGQVVGYSTTTAGLNHAFLWTSNGGMVDLGGLPGDNVSYSFGISNFGHVVGYSEFDPQPATTQEPGAFLLCAGGLIAIFARRSVLRRA
jgi:probable HAF family extracellular repeat protein